MDRQDRSEAVSAKRPEDVESQFILLHHPVDAAIASAPQPPRQIAPATLPTNNTLTASDRISASLSQRDVRLAVGGVAEGWSDISEIFP